MDLRQLEAFAAVMSAGSITAAGKMLGRSQPTITRMVQELEQELGISLFERAGPKVLPTQKAFALYSDVEAVLLGVRNVNQRAEQMAFDEQQTIRLVGVPALAAGLLPAALGRLPPERRPHQLQLHSLSPESAVQAVLARAMDLGAVSLPLEHRGLNIHWIGEAPCVAVVAEGSPLAVQASVSLAALSGGPLITIANPYRFRRRIDKAFHDLGMKPHLLDCNTSLVAMQMAAAGLGVALVDPFTAAGVPLAGLAVKPIEQRIPFFFGLVSSQAAPLGGLALEMVSVIADTARSLVPELVMHAANQHDALLKNIYAE